MATDLLSYAGWYFLPNLVTTNLQSLLYTIFIRAGDPKPAPNTPRYVRDRKRIHAFVILAYLLYTIYEADYRLRQEGDFYQVLGVPHDVSEKGVQSKFRRLTVHHHPDKASGTDRTLIETTYIRLQLARDTLISPVQRFAYDRFGPESLQWRGCKTVRDFVFTGVQRTAVYYAASAAFMVLLGVLGYMPRGMFWRFLVLAGMFGVEVFVMTRPSFPGLLNRLVNPILEALPPGLKGHPPLLPFQFLTLLRKLAITFFIALSQLTPIFQQGPQASQSGNHDISPQLLDRLDVLAKTTDQEISRLMGLELSPFTGDESTMRGLREGIKEWLVRNTVRNDAEVRRCADGILERRRREGDRKGGV